MNAQKTQWLNDAIAKLTELKVDFFMPDGVGIHIIITLRDGSRIDFWPTTNRWRRDGQMNNGASLLFRLIEGQ